MTYCGIGALSFLDRLPKSLREPGNGANPLVLTGLSSVEGTVKWLVERQTPFFHDEEDSEEEERGNGQGLEGGLGIDGTAKGRTNDLQPLEITYAGFSGRRNKLADTCYSFWVGGSLAVRPPVLSSSPIYSPLNPHRSSKEPRSSTPPPTAASSLNAPNTLSLAASENSLEISRVRSS